MARIAVSGTFHVMLSSFLPPLFVIAEPARLRAKIKHSNTNKT